MKAKLMMHLCTAVVICSAGAVCFSCAEPVSHTSGLTDKPGTNDNRDDKPKPDNPNRNKPGACEAHEKACNGVCTDIKRSRNNCGGCGVTCNTDESCVDGNCKGCEGKICQSGCVDIKTDANNCGACQNACGANMACVDSNCACKSAWFDCDGDLTNGCESLMGCECTIGQKKTAYSGPDGTLGIGECKAAELECRDEDGFTHFMVVRDEVNPKVGTLCDGKDHNCNGRPDGEEDFDGDGFSICDGDCCDSSETCKAINPELLNPGMMEVASNKTDDNCDGKIDEAPPKADSVPQIPYTYKGSDPETTARALAQAMGIIWECKPNSTCAYGLVSAKLSRSESTEPIDPRQVNIMSALRDKSNVARVLPREGKTFAVLSSGEALDVKGGVDADDLEIEPYASETMLANGEVQRTAPYSKIPKVYSNVHGGKLATHASCPTGTVLPAIFDSVWLHLEVKAPVNAKGFQFDFRFFSREYPQYLCSQFNDFFLALLTTSHEGMSEYPDRNIAFDKKGNPVSVNNGFFTTCNKIPCANGNGVNPCPKFMTCATNGYCTAGKDTCQDGGEAVAGYHPQPFVYDFKIGRGGGTAWLSTTAPAVGGETISLDFYIWDTQDNKYDSSVLIDNFKWLQDETKVNTGFAKPIEIN